MEWNRLREKIAAWVDSPEGQKSLAETAQRVRAMNEAAQEYNRLDHELLRKPMTI